VERILREDDDAGLFTALLLIAAKMGEDVIVDVDD
jgi:hypothetical protein